MMRPFALAAALIVCAGPAFAGTERPDRPCDADPETTGAVSADPRSLHRPGERSDERSDELGATPVEESWQEAFRDAAERRRQHLLACGVD